MRGNIAPVRNHFVQIARIWTDKVFKLGFLKSLILIEDLSKENNDVRFCKNGSAFEMGFETV